MEVYTLDEVAKKKVLRMFTYGLYLIGTHGTDYPSAFTGTWVTQASFDPPMVAIGVQKRSESQTMIDHGDNFTVNVLESGQKDMAQAFFKHVEPEGSTLAGFAFEPGEQTGCPVFPEALAHLECEVAGSLGEGDHVIYIGRIVDAVVHRDGTPFALSETPWKYGG